MKQLIPALVISLLALTAACQTGAPTPQAPAVQGEAGATATTQPAVAVQAAPPTVSQPRPLVPTLEAPPTATPPPTLTPQPSQTPPPNPLPPTATALPSPTPAPRLSQVTEGGCCVNPSWLSDSRLVFIDRPPDGPVGLYSVDVEDEGAPSLFAERLGYYAAGYSLLWQPVGETIRIERLDNGQVFTLRNGGRTINVAPDGRRVAWQVTPTQAGIPMEQRLSQIWVANIDGSNSRQVANLLRGGLSGWFPDGERLLVTGRPDPKSQAIAMSVLDLSTGGLTELVRVERLRNGSISPGGGWILYSVAFHPDKAQNGLWLARSDGSELRRLDFYGSVQWRDDERLVYIPLEATTEWHVLWEYDLTTHTSRPLTDPNRLPFKVANGDWTVSPDGRRVVFVSAQDNNLWMLDLP